MEFALPAMMIAGTAAKGVGSVMAGREASRAAQFEKQQLEATEQQTKTAAAQAEAQRTRDLTSSLETIQAIRAGRNTGAFSPTGRAILTSLTDDTERDIQTEKVNYAQKADLAARTATMAGRKAKTSLLAGWLGAGEAVASGMSRAYAIGNYPSDVRGAR